MWGRIVFGYCLVVNMVSWSFEAAELDKLAPVQRKLRRQKNVAEQAELGAKPRGVFSRDDASRIAVLLEELAYLDALDSGSASSSPDETKSSDGASSDSDSSGGYKLTAEERARIDKITSQVKLKLERARIERDLRNELEKPARHKDQTLIAKLSAEILYIDGKIAAAGSAVYGVKS